MIDMKKALDAWSLSLVNTKQIISIARQNGLVIRCDGAAGETTEIMKSPVDTLWVIHRRLAGGEETWVVDHAVDESIRNIITCCRPDVQLVERSETAFATKEA
jgi:hypothetical protein